MKYIERKLSPAAFGRAFIGCLIGLLLTAGCASAETGAAQTPTIVAIGDLHGDYDAYRSLIAEAGVVDARGRWGGGKAIFVQMGDVPDRGPDSRKIISHLMKLEKQARRKGGAVVALIGNHEAMNIVGDLRYVHPGEYAAFATSRSKRLREDYFRRNAERLTEQYRARDPSLTDEGVRDAFYAEAPLGFLEHRAAWSPTGDIGAWVSAHDAVHIVGDTLFVHGGISSAYAATPVEEINARVRAALRGDGDRAILEDEAGPLWFRGLAEETPEGEAAVAAATSAYGVSRIVIAHTPNLEGVRSLYGGRVVLIDTGISAYYGGTRSFLRIEGGKVTAFNNGEPTILGGEGEAQ